MHSNLLKHPASLCQSNCEKAAWLDERFQLVQSLRSQRKAIEQSTELVKKQSRISWLLAIALMLSLFV